MGSYCADISRCMVNKTVNLAIRLLTLSLRQCTSRALVLGLQYCWDYVLFTVRLFQLLTLFCYVS